VRKGEVPARLQVDEGEPDRRIEMALEQTSHRFQKCRAQYLVERAFGVWPASGRLPEAKLCGGSTCDPPGSGQSRDRGAQSITRPGDPV
jgi:hypothetical protein